MKDLIDKAQAAMKNAYAPYSLFSVGAAVLTKSGKIYCGCNVENASFGATICAERVAICSAIADGERDFKAIAIVSSGNSLTFPCGICRQFMIEFSSDMDVVLRDEAGGIQVFALSKLLPHAFDKV